VGRRTKLSARAGVPTIDLAGKTLLPGLIDAHVHLVWAGTPGTAADCRTLAAGFTTVRSLGATGGLDFALRAAIERGETPGPRMLVSGPGLGPTSGACDQVFGDEAKATIRPRQIQEVTDPTPRPRDRRTPPTPDTPAGRTAFAPQAPGQGVR
jgi:imidazolonepropionase-like amidohydrolase